MKYPLDEISFAETLTRFLEHNKGQVAVVAQLTQLLTEAMDREEDADSEWYVECEDVLKDLHALKIYHESRRFNESNGHYESKEAASEMFRDDNQDAPEGGEMSEAELARMFKEKRATKDAKKLGKTLKEMSLEEIQDWEAAQDNSNDIYKIKARIANLARGPGMALTPVGEILCNSFVHMLKSLYDFADTMQDKSLKIQLIAIIRNQESVPGTIIAAAGAGVKKEKGHQDVV